MKKVRVFSLLLALAVIMTCICIPSYDTQAAKKVKSGWKQDDKGWWYVLPDGSYPTRKWMKIKNKWYYFDKTGYMVTGWKKIKNKWYYMYKTGARAQKRWIKNNYLNKNGVWVKAKWNGKVYPVKSTDDPLSFAPTLKKKRGWFKLNKKWYYYKKDGTPYRGWVKYKNEWYYLKHDGEAYSGWLKDNGNWYYLNDSGKMRTGWINVNGKDYYLNSEGIMQTGYVTINGITYYFGDDGVMRDTAVTKAQGYSSATGYLIMVDRGAHMVYIFTGGQGNWSTLKSFQCTDGVSTPTGEFTVGSHTYHFGEEKGYTCWYATQITGDFLFHSVLYNVGSMTDIQDGRLGITASHGCIRLHIDNAKWIYENIPSGTKIVIY